MRSSFLLSFLLVAAAAQAQVAEDSAAIQLTTLSVGNSVSTAEASDISVGATVKTDIDLNGPATATGTISTVSLHWGGPCQQALKIKFFRRVGDQLSVVAERGPFDSPSAFINLTMTPPVAVQQGDLIGVTRLTGCGGARTTWPGHTTNGYNSYVGDVTTADVNAQWHDAAILSLIGTGTATEVLRWSIPAVGSTAGSFGSNWKTGLQLFNPGDDAISGRMVFHPAGIAGSASDPSTTFTLAAKQVQFMTDAVASMGQTGLGSIDIIGKFSDPPPIAVARIYNDSGTAGTSGFTQDPLDMDAADPRLLAINDVVYLVAPPDLSKMRFNIGVRTYCSGVTLYTVVRTQSGSVRKQNPYQSYPAHYFAQTDAVTFVGPIAANDTIEIHITKGTAAIYGSTTDNVTNDAAIQFAKRMN